MTQTDELIAPPHEFPMKSDSASKRILVISALAVIRDLLEQFLQINGHHVSTSSDGVEGLAKAKALPVDLIVLDSDLPESSVIRARFKTEAATSHLPVLWVGTRCSKENFEPPATEDTDGVLSMPFTYLQIRQAVSRLLGPAA
jgi:CheY-like chemotaxis protein